MPEQLADDDVLFLADILPTAFACGVLSGPVEPGDTVRDRRRDRPRGDHDGEALPAGKIVAIDLADARLTEALDFGANVAIEAVGVPEAFELCADLIRPAGRLANVGVHGHMTLHLERLDRDVLIPTGLVDTTTTPKLLRLIVEGRLNPTPSATHRVELGETMEAYLRGRRKDECAEGRAERASGSLPAAETPARAVA